MKTSIKLLLFAVSGSSLFMASADPKVSSDLLATTFSAVLQKDPSLNNIVTVDGAKVPGYTVSDIADRYGKYIQAITFSDGSYIEYSWEKTGQNLMVATSGADDSVAKSFYARSDISSDNSHFKAFSDALAAAYASQSSPGSQTPAPIAEIKAYLPPMLIGANGLQVCMPFVEGLLNGMPFPDYKPTTYSSAFASPDFPAVGVIHNITSVLNFDDMNKSVATCEVMKLVDGSMKELSASSQALLLTRLSFLITQITIGYTAAMSLCDTGKPDFSKIATPGVTFGYKDWLGLPFMSLNLKTFFASMSEDDLNSLPSDGMKAIVREFALCDGTITVDLSNYYPVMIDLADTQAAKHFYTDSVYAEIFPSSPSLVKVANKASTVFTPPNKPQDPVVQATPAVAQASAAVKQNVGFKQSLANLPTKQKVGLGIGTGFAVATVLAITGRAAYKGYKSWKAKQTPSKLAGARAGKFKEYRNKLEGVEQKCWIEFKFENETLGYLNNFKTLRERIIKSYEKAGDSKIEDQIKILLANDEAVDAYFGQLSDYQNLTNGKKHMFREFRMTRTKDKIVKILAEFSTPSVNSANSAYDKCVAACDNILGKVQVGGAATKSAAKAPVKK